MGLDGVELIMAIEAGFGVAIPDDVAEGFRTPRDVVTYLEHVLPAGPRPVCLSQRAFYQLRDRCGRHLGISPRALTPSTPVDDVVDATARLGAWAVIGAELGAERWPAPRSSTWLGRYLDGGHRPSTVGDAAQYLAAWYPGAVKGRGAGWSRAELERAVVALIAVETSIDMRRHTLDSEFVRDLQLD